MSGLRLDPGWGWPALAAPSGDRAAGSSAPVLTACHPPGRPFDVPRRAGWGPKASSRLFEAGHCPVAHTPQSLGGIVVTRGEPQARDLGG